MDKSSAIMELVSSYNAYADASELNVGAASDAPATTPVCAVSIASSWYCASAASSAISSATYELSC